MKNKIVSILLTLLLGPGAGHIYLRKIKRGFMFILSSLFFAGLYALKVARAFQNVDLAAQNPTELLKTFALAHPTSSFAYDALFAGIWAYAILDCYLIANKMTVPKENLNENN